MYFFELTKMQMTSIQLHGNFDINNSKLYNEDGDEWTIKHLTEKGWKSKKPLISWFNFDFEDGIALISEDVAEFIIMNYTKLSKVFETPDQKYQREKAAGMIALALRITDEIR